MEEKELTPRQQAVEVIKAGGSVVIGGVQYTAKNLGELPPEEVFVVGDSKAQAETLETLRAQEKQIQARIKALESQVENKAKEEKASAKSASSEAQEEAPADESKDASKKK